MLHQHIRDAILPKWFDEGVSQWISGGIAEIITGEDGKKALKEATLSKKFLRLKDLSRQFPKNAQSFILAYEQSKSIVEYIVREFGKHGLLRVLNNLKQGDEIEIAIQKGLEISFVELERTWQDYLVRRFTWPIYLSNNLYKILFFFAGLITIYGFLRLIWKIKTYKDEDDDTLDTDV
jgi:hypothetical protein